MLSACMYRKFCSKESEQNGKKGHTCWYECSLGLGKCPDNNSITCKSFKQVVKQSPNINI